MVSGMEHEAHKSHWNCLTDESLPFFYIIFYCIINYLALTEIEPRAHKNGQLEEERVTP